jgi:hypothetical protein
MSIVEAQKAGNKMNCYMHWHSNIASCRGLPFSTKLHTFYNKLSTGFEGLVDLLLKATNESPVLIAVMTQGLA